MIFQDHIPVTFSDMLDHIQMPRMYKVRQIFDSNHIADVAAKASEQMACLLNDGRVQGKRIAVTVGSRGIRHNAQILEVVIASLRNHGAVPVLIPAMGSHGGATAKGQADVLHRLGIDGDALGAEMIATMDAQQVGALQDGTPVYCSTDALKADGILVINKIKPHADFKGEYESGLVKMLAIGLGKHMGCSRLHRLGFASFPQVLPEAARIILREAPVIGGLALLENAYDDIMHIEAVEPQDILSREKALLTLAKQNIAQIKTDALDVLIIDEIGKHISGEGMDPNVTGRPGSYLNEGFDHIRIGNIVVRDVAVQSAGNGAGIGMADITTVDCVKKLDLGSMYTNSITAGILGPSRLPVVLNNDEEAIKTAIKIAAPNRLNSPRIARIRNTLLLDEIWVSQALADEMSQRPDVEILEEVALQFENGALTPPI